MKQRSRNFSLTNFVQNFVHQHLLMTRHFFFHVIMGKAVVYQILIIFVVLEPSSGRHFFILLDRAHTPAPDRTPLNE